MLISFFPAVECQLTQNSFFGNLGFFIGGIDIYSVCEMKISVEYLFIFMLSTLKILQKIGKFRKDIRGCHCSLTLQFISRGMPFSENALGAKININHTYTPPL